MSTDGVTSNDRVHTRPLVTVKRLVFSSGTEINLGPSDIVIFVGPNNAGKSVTLSAIATFIHNGQMQPSFQSIELERSGSPKDLLEFLNKTLYRHHYAPADYVGGLFPEDVVLAYWSGDTHVLAAAFCTHLNTEGRIVGGNPQSAISTLSDNPAHPIHVLYVDDDAEHRISEHFKKAFGDELILLRGVGRDWPLHVGERPSRGPDEDRGSPSYTRKLIEKTVPLAGQGDGMRSFASVLLHLLAPTTQSVLLIDEPEAFLHPPQARLIGEVIAKHRQDGAQLFVATHSVDVLTGLLNIAPDQLRIIRLERTGNKSNIKELEKERAMEIAKDPLLKYSGALSGVFHKRVIVCESDADCMFYNAILDTKSVKGGDIADVLFTQASGKQRMAKIAEAMTALNVPVDVIADIDLLNDEDTIAKLVSALGGDWQAMKNDWMQIKTSLESMKPFMQANEVAQEILGVVEEFPPSGLLPSNSKSRIMEVFKKASPWSALKSGGELYLPAGTVTNHWKSLQKVCAKIGLWIVPVGEMENFCKTVGAHGPSWVGAVLESKDLNADPELQAARDFVRRIWKSRS